MTKNLWTFWGLIIRRAWIGTVGLVLLWLLLEFGQSRELFYGIQENLWMAEARWGPEFRHFGRTGYGAFWLSALVLAWTLGLAARVTGFQGGAEPQIEAETELPQRTETRLRRAYPRAIMTIALVIAHFAFLRELPVSVYARWHAPLLMLAVLGSCAAYLIVRETSPHWRRSIKWLVPPLVIAVAFPFALSEAPTIQIEKGSIPSADVVAAIIVSITTPGIAFRLVPWFIWSDRLWTRVLIGASVILSLILFIPWSSSVFWRVGSVAIAFLALSFATATMAIIVITYRRFRLDPVLLAVFAGMVLLIVPEKFGDEYLENAVASSTCPTDPGRPEDGPSACLQAGASAATPDNRMETGFAIHADGGGIRAALYTAQVMALADDITCGEFGRHVFAASGVSGGALGIATWAVMRQTYLQAEAESAWSECRDAWDRAARAEKGYQQDFHHFPMFDSINFVLAQDHLSMALATALTTDALRPWGPAQRGQALLQSWQDLTVRRFAGMDPPPRGFATPLAETNAGVLPAPLLLFSATDADSGGRVVFANRPESNYQIKNQNGTTEPIQVGVAVLNSARFPGISPTGWSFQIDRNKWLRVVDGGYYDNSGAATLHDALENHLPDAQLPRNFFVVRIDGNPREGFSRCGTFVEKDRFSAGSLINLVRESLFSEPRNQVGLEVWSPVGAYIETRGARADEAIQNLRARFALKQEARAEHHLEYESGLNFICKMDARHCEQATEFWCPLLVRQRPAPLGWYLTEDSAVKIGLAAFASMLNDDSLLFPLDPSLFPGLEGNIRICHPWLNNSQCAPVKSHE